MFSRGRDELRRRDASERDPTVSKSLGAHLAFPNPACRLTDHPHPARGPRVSFASKHSAFPQTGVDAARFAAVNRRARRLVADESLWRELFRRRFRFELPPAFEPPAEEGGWRGVYRHHQTTLDRIVRGEASDATRRFGGCDAFSRGFADTGRIGAVHVFHGGSLLVSS